MVYKIKYDKDKCIGCGACTICDNWQLKDGKAHPLKTELEEIGCNQDAVESCPVKIITIQKE